MYYAADLVVLGH